jgi:hypothetical protein
MRQARFNAQAIHFCCPLIPLFALILLTGCSQPYEMLPAGYGAQMLQSSLAVFQASVASGGISIEKLLIEQSLFPDSPLGSATYHVSLIVDRMLKGHRQDPILSISNLDVDAEGLPLWIPTALAPALVPKLYPGFHYWIGYRFEFLGRIYGLTIMPESQPESLLRALRHWAEQNGTRTLRERL